MDELFALLRAEIGVSPLPEGFSLSAEEWTAVCRTAERHDLLHLVADAAEKAGSTENIPPELRERLTESRDRAIYRWMRADGEFLRAAQALEEAQIPFVPLKGAVLRKYYPEAWMRTGCDVDLLVKESDLAPAVAALTAVGFSGDGTRDYHDVSLFCGDAHIELHHSLRERMEQADPVLDRVWENLLPAEGQEREETPEFFVFHHIAHAAYHFLNGGCGIRPLADLWILKHRRGYDEDAVVGFCRQAGLERFYRVFSELSEAWFGDAPMTENAEKAAEYLLSGGVYGSAQGHAAADAARYGGKAGGIFRYLFLPLSDLKKIYPVLEKYPILFPVCQVRRWVTRLRQGKGGQALRRVKTITAATDGQTERMRDLFDAVGLK